MWWTVRRCVGLGRKGLVGSEGGGVCRCARMARMVHREWYVEVSNYAEVMEGIQNSLSSLLLCTISKQPLYPASVLYTLDGVTSRASSLLQPLPRRIDIPLDDFRPPLHSSMVPKLHALRQPRERRPGIPRPQPWRENNVLKPRPPVQPLGI